MSDQQLHPKHKKLGKTPEQLLAMEKVREHGRGIHCHNCGTLEHHYRDDDGKLWLWCSKCKHRWRWHSDTNDVLFKAEVAKSHIQNVVLQYEDVTPPEWADVAPPEMKPKLVAPQLLMDQQQATVRYYLAASPTIHPASDGLSVAVIVPCHNYAVYLDDCLESVLAQTRVPNEIVVVDDGSTDDTFACASRWATRGIRYIRVEHNDVRLARLAGLNATVSDIVCFLDADDRLDEEYLKNGLAKFAEYNVGIAYSDMRQFGDANGKCLMASVVSEDDESRTNHIHAGSLVRREALLMSGAIMARVNPVQSHEDWFMWRRVLEQGWIAKKSCGVYLCRQHASNTSRAKLASYGYFELAGLKSEKVTIFIALSGRAAIWPEMQKFLERQTWPHYQIRLVIMDTSQDEVFGRRVRRWLAESDYPDTRYFAEAVGNRQLADAERRGSEIVCDEVRMAMGRIYNRHAREVIGSYTIVIEDDVIPQFDVIERLLRGFDIETESVAAPYRSRYHDGFVAWRAERDIITERGNSGYEVITGNGFGCTMFRAQSLRESLFTATQPPYRDFDPAFYARLRQSGRKAKICWDVECRHLGDGRGPIMHADNWPDAWRGIDLTGYRNGFMTGRESSRWVVDTFNSETPTAIVSLGDGDVAFWCKEALEQIHGMSGYWLKTLAESSGLTEEDRPALWPLFDEALHNNSDWLCQFKWELAERFCMSALKAHGVETDGQSFRYRDMPKRKIDCLAVHRLPEERLFWQALRGKRLAIVSNRPDELASVLSDREFVRINGGPKTDWQIATSVYCPPIDTPKTNELPRIIDELERSKWTHLLCGAGGLSAIICHHAKLRGRNALDIGSLDRSILGDEGYARPFIQKHAAAA